MYNNNNDDDTQFPTSQPRTARPTGAQTCTHWRANVPGTDVPGTDVCPHGRLFCARQRNKHSERRAARMDAASSIKSQRVCTRVSV